MLDQSRDKSFRTLVQKLGDFAPEARELLKTASVNYDELSALPDSAFAWEAERLFPIHSPEQTALSLVYASGEDLPGYVCDRLEKAAALYGVELPLSEKVAEDVAEDPADYLIPHRHFGKMMSSETVKQAEDFYHRNYKKMDLETRTNAAVTLVKQASRHDVDLAASVHQQAGLTEVDQTKLAEWLEVRAHLSEGEALKSGFNKLAEYVSDRRQFSFATRQDLIKLAETIGTLDEKAGLTARYDHSIPDPLRTVFNTVKTAGGDTVTLAGKNVSYAKLQGVDPAHYGDILGADVVPEITDKASGQLDIEKLATILETLPADIQVILVKNLNL